jgi:hypothetical protein
VTSPLKTWQCTAWNLTALCSNEAGQCHDGESGVCELHINGDAEKSVAGNGIASLADLFARGRRSQPSERAGELLLYEP